MFPSDPVLLFYAGALHELFASPTIQNSLDPSGKKFQLDSKKSELKRARKYFQKAIEANKLFYEAHLHLGRVMGLLGDHEEAVGVLQQAYPFLADSRLRYYCSLFLGKELAGLSRYEDARAYYETASAMYPVSQSPLLGLSRLAHIQGNYGSALSRIVEAVELPEDGGVADDPWMFYDVYHVRNAPELISRMYKEFGEQSQ
jgi:tetratricopeptide (TPR) repeat protein